MNLSNHHVIIIIIIIIVIAVVVIIMILSSLPGSLLSYSLRMQICKYANQPMSYASGNTLSLLLLLLWIWNCNYFTSIPTNSKINNATNDNEWNLTVKITVIISISWINSNNDVRIFCLFSLFVFCLLFEQRLNESESSSEPDFRKKLPPVALTPSKHARLFYGVITISSNQF